MGLRGGSGEARGMGRSGKLCRCCCCNEITSNWDPLPASLVHITKNLPDISRAASSHFNGPNPQNKPEKADKAPR